MSRGRYPWPNCTNQPRCRMRRGQRFQRGCRTLQILQRKQLESELPWICSCSHCGVWIARITLPYPENRKFMIVKLLARWWNVKGKWTTGLSTIHSWLLRWLICDNLGSATRLSDELFMLCYNYASPWTNIWKTLFHTDGRSWLSFLSAFYNFTNHNRYSIFRTIWVHDLTLCI